MVGDLLGRAHRELQSFRHPLIGRMVWLADDEFGAVVHPVTRPTVTDQLAYGLLYGDPMPGLFRIDAATGRGALARWGLPSIGSFVFDVAPAVHHAGGLPSAGELLDGYASAGPVARDELDAALPTMLMLVEAMSAQFADPPPASTDVNDDKPQG